MKTFAVVGNPIIHSKSPNLFKSLFEDNYFKILSISAQEICKLMIDLNLSGINITSPLKEKFGEILEKQQEKAINTLIRKENKFYGYNTDIIGIEKSLLPYAEKLKGKKALLIGAGGVATSCLKIMKNFEFSEISIINRTFLKAETLAKKFNLQAKKIENIKDEVQKADFIFYTLPSHCQNLIEEEFLNEKQIIFDANYHNSFFQKIKNKINFTYINGENWLINQAIASYQYFLPNLKLPNDYLEKMQKAFNKQINTQIISLIGFMGSGKSIIGQELARSLKRKFIDLDSLIEKTENLKISQIFAQKGEKYFRDLESQILQKCLSSTKEKIILSTGGGTLLKNASILKEKTFIIWLYADKNTLIFRLNNKENINNRPLLQNDFEEKFSKLLAERNEIYKNHCDLLLDTSGIDKDLINNILSTEINFFEK